MHSLCPDIDVDSAKSAVGARQEATYEAQRTWGILLGYVLLAGAVATLPLLPEVAAAVRVSFRHTSWTMAVFVATVAAATAAYHATGVSRLYRILEYLESVVAMAVGPALLLAAGDGQSVFWLFYLVSAAQAASVGTRAHVLAVMLVPVLTGFGLFVIHRDVPGLIASLLVTAVAFNLIATYRPVFAQFAQALAAERELRAKIVAERMRAERGRLARDLHDGLGADLTALVWQARRVDARLESTGAARPPSRIAHGLRDALAALRRGVLTLRDGGS
mgnify:FL=1